MAAKLSLPGMDLMKGVGLGPLNVGNVLDTMGFVKKAWGAMNAPSSFMPTLDVEELNKRIVDLQAVEQWLVMNLSMIQGSIQALEVQRATIEALKGVSKGFMPNGLLPEAWPPGLSAPAAGIPGPVPAEDGPRPHNLPSATPSRSKNAGSKPKPKAKAASSEPGLSANAWLEFLQGQFNQVTQAAMSGSALKSAKQSLGVVTKKAGKVRVPAGKAKRPRT
jgi:hypothetical protein